jgi:CheY-like chemotaxis protein/HPt (histidine-containing phosphotransfer) domain-containing protein
LVIEDNPTNQRIIAFRARQWGMEVTQAPGIRDAMALLHRHRPFDAIILDLQLPNIHLASFKDEIRQIPGGTAVPILLLSYTRLRAEENRGQEAGFSFYVHKPIQPSQLLEVMCKAMSVTIQREKKPPVSPTLDASLARRLPLRVLLADDNPINQRVGLSVLQKLGYQADVANNGIEVLKAIESQAYHVVFLDVQMPEMDGLEAARQICQRWPGPKRPCIIAMTGNALMGDRERCLAAGMDDYISKPVRVRDLQDALERWGPQKLKETGPIRTKPALTVIKPKANSELLDQAMLDELATMPAADGISMLDELIEIFLQNAPKRIALLSDDLSNASKLAFHAHALKSMSLNLGAKRLIEISENLEQRGRSGNMDGTLALVQNLHSAFSATKQELLAIRAQP